jgi:predicted ATP-dependent Lon-type protease
MIGAVAAAGTSSSSSNEQRQPGNLATSSAGALDVYGGGTTSSGGATAAAAGSSGASASGASSGAASIRVTFDYFTLAFKDPATAQEAAAALLFQRAQYAAMRQWLYQVGCVARFSKCAVLQTLCRYNAVSMQRCGSGCIRWVALPDCLTVLC